jgi:hypothetical protein
VLFLGGVFLLSKSAEMIAGSTAARVLLWSAFLWPYAFHFGWMVGWYSFAFFAVSLLTFSYLRFVEAPSAVRWLWVVLSALALLWINYSGWAFLGCIGLDYLLRNRHRARAVLSSYFVTLGLLVLGSMPMVPGFLAGAAAQMGGSRLLLSRVTYGLWNLYAMVSSESIAPWHIWFSVPIGLATGMVVVLTLRCAPEPARKMFVGFLLLLSGMTVLGVVGTKRDIVIVPWLLLPIAVTLTVARGIRRHLLIGSLLLAVGLGWFGVIARSYYGTLRFFDPWHQVSQQLVEELMDGAGLVAYHPTLFFYLTYDLGLPVAAPSGQMQGLLPKQVAYPWVFDPAEWMAAGHPTRERMIYVKGAGFARLQRKSQAAERWLDEHCEPLEVLRLLKDSQLELRVRFGENAGHLPYRIEVHKYECHGLGAKSAGRSLD